MSPPCHVHIISIENMIRDHVLVCLKNPKPLSLCISFSLCISVARCLLLVHPSVASLFVHFSLSLHLRLTELSVPLSFSPSSRSLPHRALCVYCRDASAAAVAVRRKKASAVYRKKASVVRCKKPFVRRRHVFHQSLPALSASLCIRVDHCSHSRQSLLCW
ncbi:hypothetical protein Syun_014316 [Stephania yunnanensis]|uniref:Uncharacterized protein n=1 Tax=Stephania yunnanensis TaxID=152371 RepID=A0AAP0JK64_9MAGN